MSNIRTATGGNISDGKLTKHLLIPKSNLVKWKRPDSFRNVLYWILKGLTEEELLAHIGNMGKNFILDKDLVKIAELKQRTITNWKNNDTPHNAKNRHLYDFLITFTKEELLEIKSRFL